MKCKLGDIATVIMSIRPENIGKTVLVDTYIGNFKKGEVFNFKGIDCTAHISDHYWWISKADYSLTNMLGDTIKAYIPDQWLEPIVEDTVTENNKIAVDILA